MIKKMSAETKMIIIKEDNREAVELLEEKRLSSTLKRPHMVLVIKLAFIYLESFSHGCIQEE